MPVLVRDRHGGGVLVPQHREVRVDGLRLGGQVQPDLEQFEGIVRILVQQREHLAVDNSVAGGEPLRVALTETRRRTHGIGVVDETRADEGDRLEAAVRVAGESRDGGAVVHAPAAGLPKSWPSGRPSSDASGPSSSLPAGYASTWCATNRKGSIVCQGIPSRKTWSTGVGAADVMTRATPCPCSLFRAV